MERNGYRIVAALTLLAALGCAGWQVGSATGQQTGSASAGPGGPGQAGAAADRPAPAGTIRVAGYNIEHFMRMFDQHHLPERSQDRTELFRDEEDLYEVARTIKLDRFDPDILGIMECASQEMLERFNREWLGGRYAYVRVFAGNVPGQWLGMLAKPGFEAIEVREAYHRDVDPVDDPAVRYDKSRAGLAERNLLFSRGPAFVKFRTPGGAVLWVGVTHTKSKYGNDEGVTRWRIRELTRTRQIVQELAAAGEHVIIVGDFNDDFGMDRYEKAVGTDAVSVMLAGEGGVKLTSPTRALAEANPTLSTYHCQIKPPKYRSFIDHIFVSPSLAPHVRKTYIIDDPIAAVASDHYPIVAELALPASRR